MRITLNRLSKRFGQTCALQEVSAIIRERSITALLGPNGAGKTTLMRILAGLLPADSGSFLYDGNPLTDDPAQRNLLGYLPENNPLPLSMYVSELLEFQSRIFGIREVHRRVQTVTEQLDLGEVLHRKIGKLSKGTRQRVGIAQVLIPDPQFLILDEPSNGLDPLQHEALRQLLLQLKQEKTLLLSTHLLNEVEEIYDQTLILNAGRILSEHPLPGSSAPPPPTGEIHIEFDRVLSETMRRVFPLPILSADGAKLIVRGEAEDRPKIFTFAVTQGLILMEIQIKNQRLLDQYHQVTLK